MSFECVVLIEEDEDGMLVATVPSLRSCHTQARTMSELLKRVQAAIKLCVRADKKTPKPLRFIGLQEVRVAV